MRVTWKRGRGIFVSMVVPLALGCAHARPASTRGPAADTDTGSGWQYVAVDTGGGRTVHYWQLAAGDSEPPQAGDEGCPEGMARVEGLMRRDDPRKGTVELLQDSVCTDWIDPPHQFPRRCARFDQARWEAIAATLPTRQMGPFCMDRYEFPNRRGANPAIDLNWYEAKALCESGGKRLCSEDEWTFACEGPDALPYPYGYERDSSACNIDQTWLDFNREHLSPRAEAGPGLEHLWKGEPSGSRPKCVSPFGVYDMAGNVDEWTQSVLRTGYKSILKGGYWSVVRNRCRPATRAHNEEHEFYQQGFRCCR